MNSSWGGALHPRSYLSLDRKYLVYNLVIRNLKVKYRRSILGTLWTLIAPLSLATMYYFVFGKILHVQVPYYLAHIVAGVLAWNFFAGTLNESIDTLVMNQALISKAPVQVQIFPWVATVTNTVTLAISFPVVAGSLWISGVPVSSALVALPLFVGCLFLIVYALSSLFSIFYVYFRDLKHAMGIALQLWLYATPVFYDSSMIPDRFSWILYANPLGALWVCLQSVLLHAAWPEPTLVASAFGWTGSLTLLNAFVLSRLGRRVAEDL